MTTLTDTTFMSRSSTVQLGARSRYLGLAAAETRGKARSKHTNPFDLALSQVDRGGAADAGF